MIRMQRQSPLWVKSGKARNEQIPSGLPPKADLRCALMSNVLLIYPPGCAARGCSQERLSSNSALVLQAPVAIHISLQLLIAHVRKLVHALALYADSRTSLNDTRPSPTSTRGLA